MVEEIEKLRHLLPHWLEHSKEHTAKYEEWAEKVGDFPELAEKLRKAVEKFREGEMYLEEAIKLLEG